MPFKVGEKVKYLNESGGGVVLRILDKNMVEVESDDGFTYNVKSSELVSPNKSSLDEQEIKSRLISMASEQSGDYVKSTHDHDYHLLVREYLLSSKLNWTSRDKDFIEIDLHIEEIAKSPGKLAVGEKLTYQLNYARLCLDAAIDMRVPKIIFIHGMGAGVLKTELRKWLKVYGNVEVSDGNYGRYGMGATQVIVRGYHR